MNGIYSQIEEIECLCFDYGVRKISISEYRSLPLKPSSVKTRHVRNQTFYESSEDSKNKNKHSLKRKHASEVLQSPSIKNNKMTHSKNASLQFAHFLSQTKETTPKSKLSKTSSNYGTYSHENLRQTANTKMHSESWAQRQKMVKQVSNTLWQKKEQLSYLKNSQKDFNTFLNPSQKAPKLKKSFQNPKKMQQSRLPVAKDKISMTRKQPIGKFSIERETAQTWHRSEEPFTSRRPGEDVCWEERNQITDIFTTPQSKIYPKEIQSMESSLLSEQSEVIQQFRIRDFGNVQQDEDGANDWQNRFFKNRM